MLERALPFVEWTFIATVIAAILTAAWGFGIDVPRLRPESHKELVRLGRYRFTHHWFEHPMFFIMGIPLGSVSILFAEYVSPAWAVVMVLFATVMVYWLLRFVEKNSWKWLHLPPEPVEARRVASRLWKLYLLGLAASLVVLAL